MHQHSFQSAGWYHATTLMERMISLRDTQGDQQHVETMNTELAEQRLQSWRTQSSCTAEHYVTERFAMDGITEAMFRNCLSEPIERVCDRLATPIWLKMLAQAFSRSAPFHSMPLPKVWQLHQTSNILNVIEPLINQGRHCLHEGVQSLIHGFSELPFEPNRIEEILLENLPEQLIRIWGRTMVLELNIARLQGLLRGSTPEERFQSFLERLRQRDIALALLYEYPILARQLVTCVDHWVTSSLEFLHHLCADWQAIQTTFSPEAHPGKLVALESSLSDSHRGGKSVRIARFNSGLQVVYKPKSLAVDVHFQELLAWLNARGDHPPFRTLNVLHAGKHGWVEFVATRDCTAIAEIQRFYQRQGAFLALLYVLGATDFHFENLIAAGEHPVLIDLEALFHPRVQTLNKKKSEEVAVGALKDSVLRTGMLPQRMWVSAESEGIDFSGLGMSPRQVTPYDVPQWEGIGTDKMRLTRKPMEIRHGHHRPTLDGSDVDILDYVEDIIAGFTMMYQQLRHYRHALLSEDGPLGQFATDEMRVILRPTSTYTLLLHESFHPDWLRNALDRDRWFDRLWIGIEHNPSLAQVVPAECHDLQNGDIPIFTAHPHSRDLWTSTNERFADYFDESGMVLVQNRVRHLDEDDLEKQIWILRASLTTLATDGKGTSRQTNGRLIEPQMAINRERLLAAARSIGDRLETLALYGEDDVTWIGLTLTAKDKWALVPLGIDLYSGLPGIVLFLAYLGAISQERRYTALAQAGLATIRRQVHLFQSHITSIGGFNGWGGLIYTLTHLGVCWDQPALLMEAQTLVDLLPACIAQDDMLDIIGGAAGCICSLISLYGCVPSERTLGAAIQCADRLINQARQMGQGIGWATLAAEHIPLTGFSHGAAGMAWALLELSAFTGEKRFRTAALGAIEYERSLFSSQAKNWPDLRSFSEAGQEMQGNSEAAHFMTAWCHGAPGIGLARLGSLRHLDDPQIRAEIESALETTFTQGFGGNHSLCHGDLGNMEFLLQASQTLDDPKWNTQVNRIAGAILERIEREGWRCGTPLGVESPGLMTGFAGIGYELLRLAEPTRVHSVLLLAPPHIGL